MIFLVQKQGFDDDTTYFRRRVQELENLCMRIDNLESDYDNNRLKGPKDPGRHHEGHNMFQRVAHIPVDVAFGMGQSMKVVLER